MPHPIGMTFTLSGMALLSQAHTFELMALAAGWGAARHEDELDRVRARLRQARTGRSFLDLDPRLETALVA